VPKSPASAIVTLSGIRMGAGAPGGKGWTRRNPLGHGLVQCGCDFHGVRDAMYVLDCEAAQANEQGAISS
jgi:hypothetical protein